MLVWLGQDSPRLSRLALAEIVDARNALHVSAVTAWEFADLNRRGRFGADLPLGDLLGAYGITEIAFPADAWRVAGTLPLIHRDPIDRMLIAHAITANLRLVTADETIHRYPVRILW